jgi:hypothetical protein
MPVFTSANSTAALRLSYHNEQFSSLTRLEGTWVQQLSCGELDSGEQFGLPNLAIFTRILEADGHRTRYPFRHRSRYPSPETGDPNE